MELATRAMAPPGVGRPQRAAAHVRRSVVLSRTVVLAATGSSRGRPASDGGRGPRGRGRGSRGMVRLDDVVVQAGAGGYASLTVMQLKDILREKGLKVSGVKSDLVARLEASELSEGGDKTSPDDSGGGAKGSRGPSEVSSQAAADPSQSGNLDRVAELMLDSGVSIPSSYLGKQQQRPPPSPPDVTAADETRPAKAPQAASSSAPPVPSRSGASGAPGVGTAPAGRSLKSWEGGQQPHRAGGPLDSQQTSGEERPSRRVAEERSGVKLEVPGVVLVEGKNDIIAVQRAVDADKITAIVPLQQTFGRGPGFKEQLRRIAEEANMVFVLLDPDNTGSEYRSIINDVIPAVMHAFVPVPECSAQEDTANHQAGNVGIEHASPESIQAALRRARTAKPERDEFTMEEIVSWGLAGAFGEPPDPQWKEYGGISTRRRLMAEELGLHDGTSKTLLKNMNRFFKREEVEAALARLPGPGEDIRKKMTDGLSDTADRQGPAPGPESWPADFPMYPMKK